MKRDLRVLTAAASLLLAASISEPAFAQKQGGILRMSHFDSPASMSLHEEATAAANRPIMGVFNNLVIYKQDVPQNSLQSIVPDLAVSWSWSEEGTELTFPLRQGVKWHDGKPFTAHDLHVFVGGAQPSRVPCHQPRSFSAFGDLPSTKELGPSLDYSSDQFL